jgi:hypothetical protein
MGDVSWAGCWLQRIGQRVRCRIVRWRGGRLRVGCTFATSCIDVSHGVLWCFCVIRGTANLHVGNHLCTENHMSARDSHA